jgi:hypothetical protein
MLAVMTEVYKYTKSIVTNNVQRCNRWWYVVQQQYEQYQVGDIEGFVTVAVFKYKGSMQSNMQHNTMSVLIYYQLYY